MAAEMRQEETVSAGEAIAIFRDILGDPDMKESIFHNLVTDGRIVPLPGTQRGHWKYLRSDVESVARQRLHDMQELAQLLIKAQVVERMKERGITLKSREFDRMIETGQLPAARTFGRYRYFKPEDVDKVIVQLIDSRALQESVQGLLEPSGAVAWINRRLEEQERSYRLGLGTFYKQIEREIIMPDRIVPYSKQNSSFRYYFSEETLSNHPVFKASFIPEEMEDVKPVRITGSKSLHALEEKWGELVNRHGIKEEGLSVHAVKSRRDRKIMPVAYDGQTLWFPVVYIPPRRQREVPVAKKIKDLLKNQGEA